MKYKFESSLMDCGYKNLAYGELWVKGKAIISIEENEWSADYSDELNFTGDYTEAGLRTFEEILLKFANKRAMGE